MFTHLLKRTWLHRWVKQDFWFHLQFPRSRREWLFVNKINLYKKDNQTDKIDSGTHEDPQKPKKTRKSSGHRTLNNNFLISIGNYIIIGLLLHVIKWLLYFFSHISAAENGKILNFFQQWTVKYSTKFAQKILCWLAPTFSSYPKQTTCMKMLSPPCEAY